MNNPSNIKFANFIENPRSVLGGDDFYFRRSVPRFRTNRQLIFFSTPVWVMSLIFFIAVQNNFDNFHRLSGLLTIPIECVRCWHLWMWWRSISLGSQHSGHIGERCSIKMQAIFVFWKNLYLPHRMYYVMFHYSAALSKTDLRTSNFARGDVVVKALRYKPAGRGFDSRWCHWNFSVT